MIEKKQGFKSKECEKFYQPTLQNSLLHRSIPQTVHFLFEKTMLTHWLKRIRKNTKAEDNELAFLMKNDQRRNLVVRSLS